VEDDLDKLDSEKTFEELFPNLEDDLAPLKNRRNIFRRSMAILLVVVISLYFFPIDAFRYSPTSIFEDGTPVPVARGDNAPSQGKLPIGEWQYEDTSNSQEILFRSFIYSSPMPVVEILDTVDQQTTVRFDNDSCESPLDRADPHQGRYSCAINYGNDSFALEFNSSQINQTPAGRFLMLHEVGHLIDFKLFNSQGYEYFEAAFSL
jgi:hypothetical protein